MRLLINATNLRSEGGVLLLKGLLPALLAYGDKPDEEPVSRLLLYHNPELEIRLTQFIHSLSPEMQSRIERVPLREPDGLRRFWWEQVTLPGLIRREQVDTLLSFGNTGPLFPGCRQILYLQQSIPFSSYRPRRHVLKWLRFQWLYGSLINLAQLGSTRIIVPTGWLVKPMRRAIGYCKPESAYRVTMPGLPELPPPSIPDISASSGQFPKTRDTEPPLIGQLRQWRAEGIRILLYPCYLAPYKNIPALLQAIGHTDASTPPYRLVLTFNADSDEYFPCKAEIMDRLQACPRERVVLAGALNRSTLTQIYRETDVLIFPSLVETLGLPLLEAMSQGIPIIALDGELSPRQPTQASFAREICGDAALYASVGDSQALARQISTLLGDQTLAEQLSQNGLNRAAQFSWTAHARQILAPDC